MLDLSRFKELEELSFTNLHPRSFSQFPNAARLRRLHLSYDVCVKAENMFLPILARFRALQDISFEMSDLQPLKDVASYPFRPFSDQLLLKIGKTYGAGLQSLSLAVHTVNASTAE